MPGYASGGGWSLGTESRSNTISIKTSASQGEGGDEDISELQKSIITQYTGPESESDSGDVNPLGSPKKSAGKGKKLQFEQPAPRQQHHRSPAASGAENVVVTANTNTSSSTRRRRIWLCCLIGFGGGRADGSKGGDDEEDRRVGGSGGDG